MAHPEAISNDISKMIEESFSLKAALDDLENAKSEEKKARDELIRFYFKQINNHMKTAHEALLTMDEVKDKLKDFLLSEEVES